MKTVVYVMKRDFFGTQLLHLPFLDGLNKAYRGNELIVFSSYARGFFFRDIGLAKQVLVYERGIAQMVRMLRRIKPKIIVSLRPESDRLNIAIALSGANVRVGYTSPATRLLLTSTVPRNKRIYRALNYSKLFSLVGVNVRLDSYFREQAQLATLAAPSGRELFCMMPGGGAGEFKRWGISNFIRLCGGISKRVRNATFIFVLGPDEQEHVARIQAASIGTRSVILLNESVATCARAVEISRATVANDCGPAHIAQMMQAPLVMIFSNYDGLVDERTSEWFYPRKNARVVAGEPFKDIKTVPVERIAVALEEVLAIGHTVSAETRAHT